MLQTMPGNQPAVAPDRGADAVTGDLINIDEVVAAVRRQWLVILLGGLAGLVVGLGYILTAVPYYTATTDILVDKGRSALVDQQLSLSPNDGLFTDDAAVLSEVELIKSQKIGLAVVDQLNLTQNKTLTNSQGLISGLLNWIRRLTDVSGGFSGRQVGVASPDDLRQAAVQALTGRLDVSRVGRTYVLEVSFTSSDAQLAAQIARAYGSSYLADQLDARYEATKRAGVWLSDRLAELRQKSIEADLAVQKFRTENGLIATNGELVSDQQLAQISNQLMQAQADTTQAKAKYDRIESIIAGGDPNAVVSEALDSGVINDLRSKYLADSKTEQDLEQRLGPSHEQVISLRAEMDSYRRLMFGELGRIAESYKSAYAVAQAHEESLRQNLADSMGQTSTANQAGVTLRELQRESDTYRDLYQSFMQRYQAAIQQESFPVTQARVISEAQVPKSPTRPRKMLDLALAVLMGFAAGAAGGTYREYRERFFRNGEQVRDELGLEFLGMVPRISPGEVASPRSSTGMSGPGGLPPLAPMLRYVVDHPLSSFAETLRGVRVGADIALADRGTKLLGIVSSVPGEGKSTVAANLAALLASQGSRTLLIDGDLRNPDLTRLIAPEAEAGLLEATMSGTAVAPLLLTDAATGLRFLPTVSKHRVSHSAQLLTSPEMRAMVAHLEQKFDYVVIDLPPIAPVVDVKAFAGMLDGVVFVVEWGRTSRHLVRTVLREHPAVAERCLGVVLNKVDMKRLNLYRPYATEEYTYAEYLKYRAHGSS